MADYVQPSSAAADCSADFVLSNLSMKRQSHTPLNLTTAVPGESNRWLNYGFQALV